jgi:cob(I)alamin adenosyltransferase
MAKIYTRTGDGGETGLLGGVRIEKDAPRIEAIGSVDEVNASIGMARAYCKEPKVGAILGAIQSELFDIGAELASPHKPAAFHTDKAAELEQLIDRFDSELEELTQFILPDGSILGSSLHLARVVCRRAERRVIALSRKEKLNPAIKIYLNRLGDLLFVLARYANKKAGITEEVWKKGTG